MVEEEKSKLVVVGDVTVDWLMARTRTSLPLEPGQVFDPRLYLQTYQHFSGPKLLGSLIGKAAQGFATATYYDPYRKCNDPEHTNDHKCPEDRAYTAVPGNGPFWHVYYLVSRFPGEPGTPWAEAKRWVWRIEKVVGIARRDRPADELPEVWFLPDQRAYDELPRANVIVVDDARQGFWPASPLAKRLTDARDGAWLILKLARPTFENTSQGRPTRPEQETNAISAAERTILDFVVDKFAKRSVVVVPVDELRLIGMLINTNLSWERAVEDLAAQLMHLSVVRRVGYFVVSLYHEGALVFASAGDGKPPRVTLYYNPKSKDRRWPEQDDGEMRGSTVCLVSAIATCLLKQNGDVQDIGPAVIAGLGAARTLYETGFSVGLERSESNPSFPQHLRFPLSTVAKHLSRIDSKVKYQAQNFDFVFVRGTPSLGQVTILDRMYEERRNDVRRRLQNIVKWGMPEEGLSYPVVRFDDLLVVGRDEIDELLAIRSLLQGYASSPSWKAPVSIAVFGSPGAGKSFTIKAIARSISRKDERSKKFEPLSFNLSQFTKPQEIYQAMHQVRDAALRGNAPLVFWDEFDSRYDSTPYGWLRYFIAPMEDGTFQEGVVTHNIGRAVFVFAGGMCHSMREFSAAVKEQKDLKGPDFLSRLQGYADIPSLNYGPTAEPATTVKRALLLRAAIREFAGHLKYFVATPKDVAQVDLLERFNVDDGVIDAFIRIPSFRYGARSLQSIVKMSSLQGRQVFDRSSLPPRAQLDLHVDADAFLALVGRL